jgi:hypothetical protein
MYVVTFYTYTNVMYMYADCAQSVRNKKRDIKWSHVQLLSPHRFSTDISSVCIRAQEKSRSTMGQLMSAAAAHKRSQRESRCGAQNVLYLAVH